MSNDDKARLERIEKLLLEQAEQNNRLVALLAAGQGKKLEALEKKSCAWLL